MAKKDKRSQRTAEDKGRKRNAEGGDASAEAPVKAAEDVKELKGPFYIMDIY